MCKETRPADIRAGYVLLDGYIDVPEEKLTEVTHALEEHILLTRVEPGCLHFSVVENRSIVGRFDVSETFVDQAAFDFHQLRSADSLWAAKTHGFLRSYEIRVAH